MPNSDNGWRVETPTSKGLCTIKACGRYFTVKRGGHGAPVAKAMVWLISELNKIEPINQPGWDGTYDYRAVRGASNWSDHASGTAYDHNASQHPQGGYRYAGWTTKQIDEIRALLHTSRGRAFTWGADFTTPGRQDSMHFQLVSPKAFGKISHLF